MRTHVNSLGLLIHGDPVIPFVYPDHIARASLDALPSRPGIYIFRDDDGEALYVGKSVNIRQRVLSHLRTAEEGKLLQCSRRVDFECTGGEIGALLRESQLIKQLQPPFNQKLRGLREMCSLRMAGNLPEVVFSSEVDFARTQGLYGLFGTRAAAMETLREVADRAGLCCATLGLEKVARGRPCFARQLRRCAGVCVGAETAEAHGARVRAALEPLHIAPWPFAGAVGIVEQADGVRQVHVVDHWCYLGPRGKGRRRSKAAPQFDFDVYQILVRPLSQGGLTLELP
ncbi:MAG TPA: GIY-YIG nuclease family protein [Burkholderiaceae bacterium]|nr:GIY-YIG nuclease family protein [Burkholderiaceae bacterium]